MRLRGELPFWRSTATGAPATAPDPSAVPPLSPAARLTVRMVGAWLVLAPFISPKTFFFTVDHAPAISFRLALGVIAVGLGLHAGLFVAPSVPSGSAKRAKVVNWWVGTVLIAGTMVYGALFQTEPSLALREPLGAVSLLVGAGVYAWQFVRLGAIADPRPRAAPRLNAVMEGVRGWFVREAGAIPPNAPPRVHPGKVRHPFRSVAAGVALMNAARVCTVLAMTVVLTTRIAGSGADLVLRMLFLALLWLVTSGWAALSARVRTRSVEAVLARDPRDPVLFLRSFSEDQRDRSEHDLPGERPSRAITTVIHLPIIGWFLSVPLFVRNLARLFFGLNNLTLEQELARGFGAIGPLVAIGRPGERLATPGASRHYVPDHEWKDAVNDLLRRSQAVIWQAGDSEATRWELGRIVAEADPRRVILVVPNPATRPAEWERLRSIGATLLPVPLPDTREPANLVFFDEAWQPALAPWRLRGSLRAFFHASALDLAATLRPWMARVRNLASSTPPHPGRLRRGRRLRRAALAMRLADGALAAAIGIAVPTLWVRWVRADPRAVPPERIAVFASPCAAIDAAFDSATAALARGQPAVARLYYLQAPAPADRIGAATQRLSGTRIVTGCADGEQRGRQRRARLWRTFNERWDTITANVVHGRVSEEDALKVMFDVAPTGENGLGLDAGETRRWFHESDVRRARLRSASYLVDFVYPDEVIQRFEPLHSEAPVDSVLDGSPVLARATDPLEWLHPPAPPDTVFSLDALDQHLLEALRRRAGPRVQVVPTRMVGYYTDPRSDLGRVRVFVSWETARPDLRGTLRERLRARSTLATIPRVPPSYALPRIVRLRMVTRTWAGRSTWDGERTVEIRLPVPRTVDVAQLHALEARLMDTIAARVDDGAFLPRLEVQPGPAARFRALRAAQDRRYRIQLWPDSTLPPALRLGR